MQRWCKVLKEKVTSWKNLKYKTHFTFSTILMYHVYVFMCSFVYLMSSVLIYSVDNNKYKEIHWMKRYVQTSIRLDYITLDQSLIISNWRNLSYRPIKASTMTYIKKKKKYHKQSEIWQDFLWPHPLLRYFSSHKSQVLTNGALWDIKENEQALQLYHI